MADGNYELYEKIIIELKKEIAALRRAVISHGKIVEQNAALKKEIETLKGKKDV